VRKLSQKYLVALTLCFLMLLSMSFTPSFAEPQKSGPEVIFEVHGVEVVRAPATEVPLSIRAIHNCQGEDELILNNLKILGKDGAEIKAFTVGCSLKGVGKQIAHLKALEEELKISKDKRRIKKVYEEAIGISEKIRPEVFSLGTILNLEDIQPSLTVGDKVPITVKATFGHNGVTIEPTETLVINYAAALPILDGWSPGDGHVHSGYSRWDLAYRLGAIEGPSVLEQAVAASNSGLSWIIMTDHEDMMSGTDWDSEREDCIFAETAIGNCMCGEELGSVWPLISRGHYLAYDISSYIDSDSSCRDMVDQVNAQGGIGTIAHPHVDTFGDFFSWADWSVTGYQGLELINGGKVSSETVAKWDELLMSNNHIIGLANSDAHWQEDIGKGITYCYAGAFPTHEAIYNALRKGRAVASTGPLVVFKIGEKMIGDTVTLSKPENVTLGIQWNSTREFGKMKQIDIYANGVSAPVKTLTGRTIRTYSGSTSVSLPVNQSGYFRVVGRSKSGKLSFYAYTNPIWIEIRRVGETPICTNPAKQWDPEIWGDKIVWMDDRNSGWDIFDIYMYDLSLWKETSICTNPAAQWYPHIYMNKIVYTDHRNSWTYGDIFLYNLTTGQESQVTTSIPPEGQQLMIGGLDIYGDKIVWSRQAWDLVNRVYINRGDVFMYDLSTGIETQITFSGSSDTGNGIPSIYGDRIVWVNAKWDEESQLWTYKLHLYEISSATLTQLPISSTAKPLGRVDIYENKVVYTDYRNGNSDVYMYDLSTNTEVPIAIAPSEQSSPRIYGDKIVWQDNRNETGGVSPGNYDIYMYNLTTGQESQITTNLAGQFQPAIYGNNIVWMDGRNGNNDIYMCSLDIIP